MPEQAEEKKTKRAAPPLKQYLVVGGPAEALRPRKGAFILATCPATANREFLRRFPECRVWWTTLNAVSGRPKDSLSEGDPWADGRNWTVIDRDSDDGPDRARTA